MSIPFDHISCQLSSSLHFYESGVGEMSCSDDPGYVYTCCSKKTEKFSSAFFKKFQILYLEQHKHSLVGQQCCFNYTRACID